MAETVRKFFDAAGVEVPPENAVMAEEVELDNEGRVLSSAIFVTEAFAGWAAPEPAP